MKLQAITVRKSSNIKSPFIPCPTWNYWFMQNYGHLLSPSFKYENPCWRNEICLHQK